PVANDIPIANDDTNWIAEDAAGTASGNLLETISHPGEPSGSVTFADAEDTDIDASDVLFVSEVEGTPVTTGTIIAGLYGALTVNADGSYSYALNNALAAVQELALDETATDSFDYTVSDGHGGTDSATLTVTIFGINDDPTLAAASAAATEDGASVDVDLALYGADVDSDDDGSSLTYAILTQPSEGSASIAGTVLTFDPGAGFQDLALGETRDVQVEVQATDSHGATASNFVTVTVTGVNDDPTLAAASAAATEDGASVDVDLSLYGADVDSDDDGSSLTYAILTQPSEGSASIAGTVLTFDPGADFQDLAFNETRDVQIEVQATDSHGATASNFVTVTVTGVNDDPVAANDTNWILEDSGLPTSGNVLADTAHGPDHADVADTDPDTSDILTVSAVNGVSSNVGIAVAGTYGTLTLQSDGSYSYTLDDLAPGLKDLTDGESAFDSFAYTIDDGNGGTATASLEIEVLGNGTIYDVPGATPTVIAAFETDDDFLDLSSLLDANFAPGVKADYVQATVDATGIMISVDTDGSANGASFVDVAHLDGVFSGTISYVYDGGTETVDAGIGVGM
ncbi:MAG: Ig-like domain-containing protein, partial [Flavobacteriaceae bacterium]